MNNYLIRIQISKAQKKVSQRINTNVNDKDYKIYTKQFDEIERAELLETSEEISKLRKKFRPTIDLISRFNNKTCK